MSGKKDETTVEQVFATLKTNRDHLPSMPGIVRPAPSSQACKPPCMQDTGLANYLVQDACFGSYMCHRTSSPAAGCHLSKKATTRIQMITPSSARISYVMDQRVVFHSYRNVWCAGRKGRKVEAGAALLRAARAATESKCVAEDSSMTCLILAPKNALD